LPTQVACAYGNNARKFIRSSPRDSDQRTEPPLTATLRDIILQVKENADIVGVIGQYVPLRKAGSRYVGLCPFHHDRSPSMNVTPQMGIYKCFACGAGGDVLKFVQEYEKLDFLDALKIVAARAGVTIPEHIAFSKDDGDKTKSSQALAANQLACQLYQEELAASPEVLAYLAQRGIADETRKHFQLGLGPATPEKLLKRAAGKGIPDQALMDAGILGETQGGRRYDRFGGRLIFPIWNLSGHVIGFGGRILAAEGAPKDVHQPKYVNSPESAFYHKSKVLYGLNFARNPMDKAGEAVIVEGYMDLLALWQAGIRNVVAVSGTALTKDHVHILGRFCRKAYLFLDGDEPGRKAVRRSLEPLLTQGIEVRVPVLPSPEDPDSFTRKFGGDKVRELFAQGEDIVAFLLRSAHKPVAAMSPEEKDGLLQECLGLLQAMPSPIVREQHLEELRKRLGLKAIRVQVARPSQRDAQGAPRSVAADGGEEKADLVAVFAGPIPGGRPREEAFAEWQMLQALVSSPVLAPLALDTLRLEWFQVDVVRDLVDHFLAFVEEAGAFAIKDFAARLTHEQQEALGALRIAEGMDPAMEQRHFQDLSYALELRWLQKQAHRTAREQDMEKHLEFKKRIRELTSKAKGEP
jgi:DNA primase catalytic core